MSNEIVNVLLVEDDEVDVIAVKRAFKKCKISNPVHVASNGIDALKLLRDEACFKTPYLILLDLNMPKMNGIEFLKELRQDSKLNKSVVFVLTTSENNEDKLSAYDLNVAGYIIKSNVNSLFNATIMLDHYWKVVQFP